MTEKHQRASLSRSQGKESWCLIFRHPLVNDASGNQKLRVRRGLGTSDKDEAQRLVDQMNDLLADPTLHKLSAKERAEKSYEKRVVAAFYDRLEPAVFDSWSERDKAISMPGPQDGYVRVLLLGTTGAGKTTLVRQLIGTDPGTERFPSTSAAKTTTCNIEIILAPETETYEGVVSFLPEDRVRQCIEDCVTAAAMEHIADGGEEDVAKRLLLHSEQRFRLNYLLGGFSTQNQEEADGETDEEVENEGAEEALVPAAEKEAMAQRLKHYIAEIIKLAESTRSGLEGSLGGVLDARSTRDRDAFEELFEDALRKQEDFGGIVDTILDDVASRFDPFDVGLVRGKDGWPKQWSISTKDRKTFLKAVNQFSSNYAPHFGRLLTPLVEGIRVAGPFKPEWTTNGQVRFVIIDGEGLGHTPETTSSISTSVTRRYGIADAIILVDNAAQPMQAASCAVLRSLVASGHENKLAVTFTHFDDVKGDNLPSLKCRKAHVQNSVDNATASIGAELGHSAANALKRVTGKATVYLASIDESVVSDKPSGAQRLSQSELGKLVDLIQEKITPPEPPTSVPVYDDANLVLSIQKAMQEFREPWRARLGFPSRAPISAVHWARIKALTRRLGELGLDEYDTLRPVADMIARLSEHISTFLSTPLRWEQVQPTDEKQQLAIDGIERRVFSSLHEYAKTRMFLNRVKDWGQAYSHRGPGSTFDRATAVERIYDRATPIPNETPDSQAMELIRDVRRFVRNAVKEGGGKLVTES